MPVKDEKNILRPSDGSCVEDADNACLEGSIYGDADVRCSMCGEYFAADEINELAEMCEPFWFCDGKFLCPDCYDMYKHQTLEDQFETALHMEVEKADGGGKEL